MEKSYDKLPDNFRTASRENFFDFATGLPIEGMMFLIQSYHDNKYYLHTTTWNSKIERLEPWLSDKMVFVPKNINNRKQTKLEL